MAAKILHYGISSMFYQTMWAWKHWFRVFDCVCSSNTAKDMNICQYFRLVLHYWKNVNIGLVAMATVFWGNVNYAFISCPHSLNMMLEVLLLIIHGYSPVSWPELLIFTRKWEFPRKMDNPSVSMETDMMLHFLSKTNTRNGFLIPKLPLGLYEISSH